MQNRYTVYARKSDAKNKVNHPKTNSTRSPPNIKQTIKQWCRILMRQKVPTGVSTELTYKSKTPPERTYKGNLLNKKTNWQGTTSQVKHALGAFGPGTDLSACTWTWWGGVVGWNSVDGGVCGCSAGALTVSGDERNDFGCQNGARKIPKTIKTEPTWRQTEPRNFQKHYLRNRCGKGSICVT